MTIPVPCRHGRRFDLAPETTALLVIDMQRDFLDPSGMCARAGEDIASLRAVMPRVQAVTAAARAAGLTLIHTREGYAPDLADVNPLKRARGSVGAAGPLGRFLIRGEAGHDFIDGFQPAVGEAVIDKPGFGAFHRTDLETRLRDRGITHLVLTGVTTQCCVHTSLREAVDRGFFCLTVDDACAAFDPTVHAATLDLIEAENHLFGWIAGAGDFVGALAGDIA